jgi:hypothetical protein
MAARVAASATVRAVKARKPFPTRAALVLVSTVLKRMIVIDCRIIGEF